MIPVLRFPWPAESRKMASALVWGPFTKETTLIPVRGISLANPLPRESETFAAYLDLGYEFALIGSLDGYLAWVWAIIVPPGGSP